MAVIKANPDKIVQIPATKKADVKGLLKNVQAKKKAKKKTPKQPRRRNRPKPA